ncbi:MAG TPA: polysaccharide biosynthesis/export family protein [Bacteroidia bacterium]|nr:polysaccharide biosynthesis/export family protein [Bacteroidia bacterium]
MKFPKLGFILLITLMCSCISLKKTVYLQDSDSTATSGKMPDFVLKIHPNDILSIQVFTINTEAFPGIASTVDKQIIDNRSPYEKGFVLDRSGFVELPLIGKINLAELSIADARDSLVKRFEQYMDDPIVVLKKLSFKVTVLGEVNKPGLYYIPNEKITMLEAIGMAGDLTPFGNRKEIKVVRQTPEGYKEIMVDITTKAPLNSEVAYMYPDDVIYIQPIKRRSSTTISPTVAIVTSILATLTLMVSVILREN